MKISAALIVRNEEAVLLACLESLRDFDEIVVVDTGSTDGTHDIVTNFHGEGVVTLVTDYEWQDDFSDARNHAAFHCTGDWILHIDADNPLISTIEEVREQCRLADVGGHKTCCVKAVGENGNWHWVSALHKRRRDVKWDFAVHEALTPPTTFNAEIQMKIGRSENHAKDPDRNLRILLKSDLTRPRHQFYLGKEFYERKNYGAAIGWLHAYVENPQFLAEHAWAWLLMAYCYDGLGKNEKARHAAFASLRENPEGKETMRLLARLHAEPHATKWRRLAETASDIDTLFIRN